MRVLLDENVPHDLIPQLAGHDVPTVWGLAGAGIKNGKLLRRKPVLEIAGISLAVRGLVMPSSPLTELLKLPAGDRAELAMALWESLADAEREGEFELSDTDRAELDRRWTEHIEHPDSAVPWSEVRSKLIG